MSTDSAANKVGANPLNRFVQWMAPKKKYAHDFQEGSEENKSLLGAKAAILCEMTKMKIPVPSGFVLSNEAYQNYINEGRVLSKQIKGDLQKHIHKLERETGQLFGDIGPATTAPLLLSVRVSSNWEGMPGLTDTVLNLGMNETIVHAMAATTGCPRFAYDTYRRFLQTYATHVLGVKFSEYENIMVSFMKNKGYTSEQELTTYDLQGIITMYNEIVTVPSDCWQQLYENIEIIYNSYESPAASLFRETHGMSNKTCTPGVIIQSMVYGNRNSNSGTGIFATRNPCTGQKAMTGEFIQESEGEDMVNIVASAATTASISPLKHPVDVKKRKTGAKLPPTEKEATVILPTSTTTTEDFQGFPEPHDRLLNAQTILSMGEFQLKWPKVYDALQTIANKLEKSFKDIQDIEFTVQDNNLFILEARSARRSAKAAVKVCVDMVQEQVITQREAILRIDPMKCLFFEDARMFAPGPKYGTTNTLFGCGNVMSAAGVASGQIVFTEEQLRRTINAGFGTILVVDGLHTSTDAMTLLCLIKMANGVLISNGHLSTCVPAIQARDLGKCAISFTEKDNQMFANFDTGTLQTTSGDTLKQGAMISIDGFTGNIANGEVDTVSARMDMDYQIIMSWAKEYKRLSVLTSVNDMKEIHLSQVQDAEGIGQCRTDSMFLNSECNILTCAMILTDSHEDRCDLLDKMLPYHQAEVLKVYRAFPQRQISFRLLDVPLSCLIPLSAQKPASSFTDTFSSAKAEGLIHNQEIQRLSETLGLSVADTTKKLDEATKNTPLLGLRGSRLFVLYPEVTAMQTKAIIGASIQAAKEGILLVSDSSTSLEICIPLVCSDHEVEYIAPVINAAAKQVMKQENFEVSYGLCTSFDVPRACMRAESIATEGHVSTVIFNTDMITQLVYGFPRGDANRFLSTYVQKHILTNNPFESIDRRGVGAMLELAISKIRKANPKVCIGICGSHGGDPSSVRFFNNLNVDFISVPPRRLAIATISAAKSQITSTTQMGEAEQFQLWVQMHGINFL